MIENIDNLDEGKILGYFETIKCSFLTKLIFLHTYTKDNSEELKFDYKKFDESVLKDLFSIFPKEELFFKALKKENTEVFLNYFDDIGTSAIVGVWNVFEQIIKNLPNPNYSHSGQLLSADFKRNDFGFSTREKKDLDLFYYIRNSIQHYNGAYYAQSEINHTYAGKRYVSKGHIGEKLEIPLETIYKMINDIEALILKAFSNFNKNKSKL